MSLIEDLDALIEAAKAEGYENAAFGEGCSSERELEEKQEILATKRTQFIHDLNDALRWRKP